MKTNEIIFLLAILLSGGAPGFARGQNAGGGGNNWAVERPAWSKCTECGGKGTVIAVKCTACGGSGNCQACDGTGFQKSTSLRNRVGCLVCKSTGQCKSCNGTGGTREKCSACKGTGQVSHPGGAAPDAEAPQKPDRVIVNPPAPRESTPLAPKDPESELRNSMSTAAYYEYTLRRLRSNYEARAIQAAAFRAVLKSRAAFVGKVLQSEAYILEGNPRGVVAGVSASPAADEIVLVTAPTCEFGDQVAAVLEREPALRKAVIVYGVQNSDHFVLYSITSHGSGVKPANASQ